MDNQTENTKKKCMDVIVFVGTLLAILLVALVFFCLMRKEEQKRIDQLMLETGAQSAALLHERLTNDITHIEELGRYLGRHDVPINAPQTLRFMQGRMGDAFESITAATQDGTLYGTSGAIIGNIAKETYFNAAMAGNVATDYVKQNDDAAPYALYAAAPITRNGVVVGTVNGRFDMTQLASLMTAQSFSGKTYGYLASPAGDVLVWAEGDSALGRRFTDLNAWLKSNPSVTDAAFATMRQNMQSGKTGNMRYDCKDGKCTMQYTPIGVNDWYLLSVLPNKNVSGHAKIMMLQVLLLIASLIFIAVLLVLYLTRAQQKSQKMLAAAHEEILTLYNTIPGGIFKCRNDEMFTLLEANDGFYRTIGYTRAELQTKYANQLACLMQPADLQKVRANIARQSINGRSVSDDEVQLVDASGHVKWLFVCADITHSLTKKPFIYGCFSDVSQLKRTQQELRDAKRRYDLIMAETQSILFEWNPNDGSIFHSKVYEQKFGYPPHLDNFPESVVEQHLVPAEETERFLAIYQKIGAGEHFATDEIHIKKSDGTFLWCRVSATAVFDENQKLHRVVGVIEDIDQAKREMHDVTEKAKRDMATGLYNKATTEMLISARLRKKVTSAAFLIVDIDNFKDVNDTLGHAAGDTALIEVSHKLKNLFRTNDIVGRFGGDEFIVFLDGVNHRENLESKLKAISEVFNWSFCKNDIAFAVSCSIGASMAPQDGITYTQLLRKADAALYYAKKSGKNQFAIYSNVMQAATHGVDAVMTSEKSENSGGIQ
ncbi:MAG: diguanylate cyclase [Ruthenibacterium sp.]